ncbi:hypothetical protein PV10_08529 [Exophiala mesophila]|uniref:Holocytochrome c-type synthase n=1 Tax=Exophiala mesophila TaxID=212818 RepID=A0A0D1Z4Q4_EXOME|nr:uncharacterized protein PV10_08529 [Exophiala mesophila]KIV88899.1 hypothetical protein PV10_08529 [Exophiala mesophila]
MGWWKADPVPDPAPPQPTSSSSSSPPPHPIPSNSSSSSSASACPVDPQTRSIWLKAAQQKSQSANNIQSPLPASHPQLPLPPSSQHPASKPSEECSSDRISQSPSAYINYDPSVKPPPRPLSQEREISTIPRAMPPPPPPSTSSPSSTPSASIPSNSETETGVSSSGNWIYPSETQFYNAVMRKQTAASEADLVSSISSIIPIHNAVNERAWYLIKGWEGNSSESCGGPKLASFQGLGSGALSPKARMRSLVGYTQPFDRHDWVVERCDGKQIEYVIDFYQGKATPPSTGVGGAVGADAAAANQKLNFFLDVRPKLNSAEGCKMRVQRFFGWR